MGMYKKDAIETGLPLFPRNWDRPAGWLNKKECNELGYPVKDDETPIGMTCYQGIGGSGKGCYVYIFNRAEFVVKNEEKEDGKINKQLLDSTRAIEIVTAMKHLNQLINKTDTTCLEDGYTANLWMLLIDCMEEIDIHFNETLLEELLSEEKGDR